VKIGREKFVTYSVRWAVLRVPNARLAGDVEPVVCRRDSRGLARRRDAHELAPSGHEHVGVSDHVGRDTVEVVRSPERVEDPRIARRAGGFKRDFDHVFLLGVRDQQAGRVGM